MIKETLMKAGRYDDVMNILTGIILNTDNTLQPVDIFVGDNGKAETHVSGLEVKRQALELLDLIKEGKKFEYFESPEMFCKFRILYQFVHSHSDVLLHNYAVDISHRNKPNSDMESIRSWEILENLIINFGMCDESHTWYIPDGWKKITS